MLVVGIIYHLHFMIGLRRQRAAMREQGLVHAESGFPPSLTVITAILLLIIGVVAISSLVFHTGPFD
jgi:putative membrane protein